MAIPALYWRSLNMSSPAIESDADIWNIIKQMMKEIGLTDVKKNASDVNGHTQDTMVATTFAKARQQELHVVHNGCRQPC